MRVSKLNVWVCLSLTHLFSRYFDQKSLERPPFSVYTTVMKHIFRITTQPYGPPVVWAFCATVDVRYVTCSFSLKNWLFLSFQCFAWDGWRRNCAPAVLLRWCLHETSAFHITTSCAKKKRKKKRVVEKVSVEVVSSGRLCHMNTSTQGIQQEAEYLRASRWCRERWRD